MQTRPETVGRNHAQRAGKFVKGYTRLTAGLFAAVGLVLLYTALDRDLLLRQPDAVFGVSNRTLAGLAGLLHFALGCYLFAGRDGLRRGLLTLWAGTNHLVYCLGMVLLHVATPLPVVQLAAWNLGLRPRTLDLGWKLFIAYLVIGSLLLLLREWRHLKQASNEAFLKRWLKEHEHGRAT